MCRSNPDSTAIYTCMRVLDVGPAKQNTSLGDNVQVVEPATGLNHCSGDYLNIH